nr:spore cortex-lytic enzyme [Orenia marismortui]
MRLNRKFTISLLVVMLVIIGLTMVSEAASLGDRILYFGSTGYDVRQLQTKLNHWGYNPGMVDGVYGRQTENAVINFQSEQNLRIDGFAGRETINRLLGKTTFSYAAQNLHKVNNSVEAVKASKYIMPVNQEEINLLARAVYSEARGESYQGQVAVAAVILNRVKDKEFPNTIKGVIFQPWAFTAVHDGQFWLQPNSQAMKAAKDALKGWDPSHGATFYYNPAKVTSMWIYSRPIITKIGRHYFAG